MANLNLTEQEQAKLLKDLDAKRDEELRRLRRRPGRCLAEYYQWTRTSGKPFYALTAEDVKELILRVTEDLRRATMDGKAEEIRQMLIILLGHLNARLAELAQAGDLAQAIKGLPQEDDSFDGAYCTA